MIESRDTLFKPVVMRFNEELVIADFGVTVQELDLQIKARWALAREQAELREELSFKELQLLDLSEQEAVLSWFLRVGEEKDLVVCCSKEHQRPSSPVRESAHTASVYMVVADMLSKQR